MKTRSMVSFDWAMKRLLRSKANFDILEGFLSEWLRRQIKIKNIGASEGNKENKEDKYNRVDIFVEADNKELVIIELQFYSQSDYFQRMLYGTSKAIIEHIHEGDDYDKVRKVYSINIVYFDLGIGDDYVYHGISNFTGLHTHNELQLDDKQKELYNKSFVGDLYPEYYILKVKNFDDIANDPLDQWIYYLKNNRIQDDFTAQGLDKAREILSFDKMSEEEKKQYWRNVEERRIKDSEIFTARYNGRAEGKEEGRAEGRAEGEKLKTIEIAKELKKDNMPIELIAKYTNLSIEEIEKI
jgi:predicted transposase/invertase (TIGR01784 family)